MHERMYVIMNNKSGMQPETELNRIRNLKHKKLIELAQKRE